MGGKVDAMEKHILKHIRKIRSLSQAEVCAEFELRTGRHLSDSTLSAWENGQRRVFADDLVVLREIYGISLDVLCGRVGLDEHSDLFPSFAALPENEKSIINHLFNSWMGDTHGLINLMAMYMIFPEDVRGELLLYLITRFEEEKAKGNINSDLRIDSDLVVAGLENLMKKR